MNKHQQMVKDMMELFEQEVPDQPSLVGYPFMLRGKLIYEEALEFLEASGIVYEDGEYRLEGVSDWQEMIDAICDILVVTYGAANAMGIDVAPFFAEVHRANMTKVIDGKIIRRELDNKVLKPDDWQAPRIAALLANQLDKALDKKESE